MQKMTGDAMSGTDNISMHLFKVQDYLNTYNKRIKEVEKEVENYKEKNEKLKISLKIERFKSNIMGNLLKTYNVDVESLFKTEKDGVHLHGILSTDSIPIFFHTDNEIKTHVIKVKKKGKKAETFRAIGNKIDLVKEKPVEQEEKIKKIKEDLDVIVKENNFDISYSDTINSIEDCFKEITSTKQYSKLIENIKTNRLKLVGKLSYQGYVKLITTHVKRLESILRNKKCEEKKIPSIITKGLTSLEQRLLFYSSYYTSYIDVDELQRYKTAMSIKTDYAQRYIPFNYSEVYNQFNDYTIALFLLKDNLERILVNPFGFTNIVYLPIKESDKNKDPFRYYILERIESNGNRCWKIDYRLIDLTRLLSEHIKSYIINLFRKIYFDVYKDNDYRNEFQSGAIIFEQDCKMILSNLLSVCKPKSFNKVLKKLFMQKAIIQPSEIDKFNFYADDSISKREYESLSDSEEHVIPTFKRLFDTVSDDDIKKLVNM